MCFRAVSTLRFVGEHLYDGLRRQTWWCFRIGLLAAVFGLIRQLLGTYSFVQVDYFLHSSDLDTSLLTNVEIAVVNRSSQSRPLSPLHPDRAFVPLLHRTVDLPLRVVYWPYVTIGSSPDAIHVGEDGLFKSPYIQLVDMYDDHPDTVWVADETVGGNVPRDWCENLLQAVHNVRRYRRTKTLPLFWPIHFLQTHYDFPSDYLCKPSRDELGGEYWTRYFKRSVILHRSWNETLQWVDTGYHINSKNRLFLPDQIHTPLVVRSDIVEAMHNYLKIRGRSLSDDIASLPRPIDVIHLWPLGNSSEVYQGYSNLRTIVSQIVVDLSKQHPDWKTVVGIVGKARYLGRQKVSRLLIQVMLTSKIHVVSQRDQWEDHYRLMEALASGALVLTDRMLSLPEGLKNGTSLIEYSNSAELREYIQFYIDHEKDRLSIAREGRFIAMSKHRSWHRMEEVLFGRIISLCSESPNEHGPCSFEERI